MSFAYMHGVMGKIAACSPSANGTLTSWLNIYQNSLSGHKMCRKEEKALQLSYNNCTRTTPGTDCVSTVSESRGDYLQRLKAWFTTEHLDWRAKKGAYDAAKALHDSLICNDYNKKKSACDAMLTRIENHACSYAQGLAMQCNNYDDCYKGKVAAYESAKSAIQAEETGYKVQWRSTQRVKCIVLALGNGSATDSDSTALQSCLTAAAADTSHLNVEYPDIPGKSTCSGPTTYPCTDEYKSAVYGHLPVELPVPTCNDCQLPTATDPTLETPGARCDSVNTTPTKLGETNAEEAPALAVGSTYFFLSHSNQNAFFIARYDISNMAAGYERISTDIGRFPVRPQAAVLNPSESKLYLAGQGMDVFECGTTPAAGCSKVKNAHGQEQIMENYGVMRDLMWRRKAIWLNPAEANKLWIAPGNSKFGYFDLAEKQNYVVSSDLSPLEQAYTLMTSADGASMFLWWNVWCCAVDLCKQHQSCLARQWIYPRNQSLAACEWKKSICVKLGRNAVAITCYENCDPSPDGVNAEILDYNYQINFGRWNPKGDKFIALWWNSVVNEFDGVGC